MTDDARFEEVEEHIEQARKDAEEAGILHDPDEQEFYESGTEGSDLDDQTIAPPG